MTGKILIVDDSGFARRTLRQMLESAGHSIEEAANANDALERYYLKRPDLVLLDIVMEGLSGLEVLPRIKEMDPDARVVVASADIQTSTRDEAQAAGAVGFINKPFVREQVLETVSHVLAGGMAWN